MKPKKNRILEFYVRASKNDVNGLTSQAEKYVEESNRIGLQYQP